MEEMPEEERVVVDRAIEALAAEMKPLAAKLGEHGPADTLRDRGDDIAQGKAEVGGECAASSEVGRELEGR